MHVDIRSKVAPDLALTFEQHLVDQCRRLSVHVSFGHKVPMTGRRVVVVFAGKRSSWAAGEDRLFRKLVDDGVTVLPVVPDAPSARYLPTSLSHINAFVMGFFGEAWAECLADEVLSMAWLHRRTPKVFISYKRTDSAPIAAQLYDRFNHLGYETFLDEASVPRGADFQRELKWWLNDADLLIVLASPRFPLSKWCMEEVSFCQQRFIGIAAIEWPDAIYEGDRRIRFPDVDESAKRPVVLKRTTPDQVLTLRPEDFAGKPLVRASRHPDLPLRELTPRALSRVLAMCARQRTVAIRQRLDDLIPLAQRLLKGSAPIPGASTPGDLVFMGPGGASSFARVLPFRPRPENIREACIDGVKYGSVAGCFYAENDPYDPRAQALRWLIKGTRPPDKSLSDGWVWACCGGIVL